MKDGNDYGSTSITMVTGQQKIPAHQWTRVRLNFNAVNPLYNSTDDPRFSFKDTVSITFVQGLDDNVEHTLFVDDFMVVKGDSTDTAPPPTPAGLTIRGYERHCDLKWDASDAPDLLDRALAALAARDALPRASGSMPDNG